MTPGFLAIPRHLLSRDRHESPFYGDPAMGWVYALLCSWANHADAVAPTCAGIVLKRGEILVSQEEIQGHTGYSRKVVRRVLDGLKKGHWLGTSKVHRKGHWWTVITINDYEKLFLGKNDEGPQEGPQEGPKPGQERANSGQEDKKTKRQERQKTVPEAEAPGAELGTTKVVQVKIPRPKPDGVHVWESYRDAYVARYGHEPTRNGKVNSLCVQLVARLGLEQAVRTAKFYVGHNGRFYQEKLHMLDFCIKDAEKLATETQLNSQMTSTRAQQMDLQASNREAIEAHLRAKHGS